MPGKRWKGNVKAGKFIVSKMTAIRAGVWFMQNKGRKPHNYEEALTEYEKNFSGAFKNSTEVEN